MKKLNKRKVLNMVAALLFAFTLMVGNMVSVSAYTADTSLTGYPVIIPDMQLIAYDWRGSGETYRVLSNSLGEQQEQNSYYFNLGSDIKGLNGVEIGSYNNSMIFPFDPELYDYYVVGTFASVYPASGDYMFNPYYAEILSYENGVISSETASDFDVYPFEVKHLRGMSFSFKATFEENSTIAMIRIGGADENNSLIGSDCYFSASIVPVAKSGTEVDTLNSVLQALNQINQNLITSNTLQQQTIDAINQHDANEKSWFQQLIYNMGVGFSALYEQMTKEQDEQLNGYQDTTQSDAANQFSSESDKLTSLEGELSNQSNQYVSDYTAEGFDLGILATIGSSLVFVATWFTNFWNMGGIFTAGLNMCFALSIVFFIFRIKR